MPALNRLIDHPDTPEPPGARVGVITTADRVDLRWATFAPLAPSRGTVLALHGRTEFIERWFETVRDLQVRGFTVATFDWRGQGGSQRLARHPRKGHVSSFDGYARDLETVVTRVMPALPRPWFVLGHSTGALMAVAEAEALLAAGVERAVLTAPFLGLGGRHAFGEPSARVLSRTLRALMMGRLWIPGGGPASIHTAPFEDNPLTTDPVRHARNAAFSREHPDVVIGAPTIGWVAAGFDCMDRATSPAALEAYRLPTLIFACGADRIVSNRAIERFVVATRSTEMIVLPGARHELLQERDLWRERFWAAFDAFVPGTRPAQAAPTSAPEGEQA